jgi:hypothetical protein
VLSAVDREQATLDGEPLHPGVDQLVIGMRRGKVEEIRVFQWQAGTYRGSEVPFAG